MQASIGNELLELSVKSKGAELSSIRGVRDGFEYLWQGDPASWAAQSPLFFPIIGRLENSKYSLFDQAYQIGMHGFARDCEFDLVDAERQLLCFRLSENETTLEKYPFRFELLVCYSLDGNRIVVEYTVRNTGDRTMWYSIGGHPGFNCPFGSDGRFEDYVLELEREETVGRRIVEEGFLSSREEPFLKDERTIPLSRELFKRLAIVLTGVRSKHVTLKSRQSTRSVTVSFDGFPYLAFWSHATGGSFVCIEPWQGVLPTKGIGLDLREKEGINSLGPASDARSSFAITIEQGS